jgi:signal transduction histidine kinase
MVFIVRRPLPPHDGCMTPQTLWSAAAIANAAFALAALTMGVAFARRVQLRGRAIVLLLTLLALTVFYACAATAATTHEPAWTLAAFVLQISTALFCLHFVAASSAPLLESVGEGSRTAYLPVGFAYAFLAIAAFRLYHAPSIAAFLSKGESIFPLSFLAVFLTTLGVLFRRLPKTEQIGPFWRTTMRSQLPMELISLNLTPVLTSAEPLTIPATSLDVRSLATAYVPALLVNGAAWTIDSPFLLILCQLAMLPSIAGLIYFQTRATFFDLLIKRGAVLAVLCLLTIAAPLGVAIAIPAMAAAYAWSLLLPPLDALLDRTVFGRPNYRQTLAAITAAIAKCPAAPAAIDHVTQSLTVALRADWVRFAATPDPAATAIATVAGPAKQWGILSLGPRRRGQPYQSQDATFIDSVSAQLAAALEGLDARAQLHLAAEAELRALRAQIHPHFLFNSLNSLADMVKDTPATEQAVLNLARIFRYALDSTRHPTVSLDDELRFLTSYLDIESLRFEHRLTVQIDCPDALRQLQVPPMLIQPLIENAVKHGIAPQLDGGAIRLVIAQPQSGKIQVTVADTGAGFNPNKPRSGVGIDNVRRRVEALPNGRFHIDSSPGQGTRLTLEWSLPCES